MINSESVYYVATAGTEAHKRCAEYFEGFEAIRKRTKATLKGLGFPKKAEYYFNTTGGELIGVECAGDIPEGWKQVLKGRVSGKAIYPKATKENRALIAELRSLKRPTPSSFADKLFGKSKLYFSGLCVTTGVGVMDVAGRFVISFKDDKHAKMYLEDKALPPPKGLKRVKASTVCKWEEESK